MRKSAIFAAALIVATAFSAQGGEGRLLRFPATNGHAITFSYAGDLYTVPIGGGTARRLTSHKGYEAFARYSPDGTQLAFTAQYDGNTEVYVMPAEGGEPRRITFTASNPRDDWGDRMGPNNIAMTWTPDGTAVIYRNRLGDGFDGQLWRAPIDGSMPEQLPLPEGGFCCYSPNGQQLAYNRVFREFRTWKYYRGGMADDIWIYDIASKQVKNITGNVAQDIVPMWIGDEIFYASDRDMTMNLFAYNTRTGVTEKVTDFTDYDVKFPSCGGGIIVFEKGGYLYTLDPATRAVTQVHVEVNSENIFAREALLQLKDYVTAAALAPDGSRLVVSARGEVVDVPVKHGVTRNLTHSSGVHERNAQWSPDGKHIAYISDLTGETELWMRPAEGGDAVQLTKDNDTYILDFAWSPKSDRIVYTDRENRIVLVDVAARSRVTLAHDSIGAFPTPQFSPDGRWITYHQHTRNDNSVVMLYDIDRRQATAVTDNWFDSNSPVFSTDGRYLLFASGRDFNPQYSSIEWNFAYGSMEGIYMVMLSSDTPSPLLLTDDKVKVADTDDAKGKTADKKEKNGKKGENDDNVVKIDLKGIGDRIVKLPLATSSYGAIACDGEQVWYYGNGGTHLYNLKEQKDELIAPKAMMQPSADMKKAVFFSNDKIYVTDMPQGKVDLDTPVDLDDMTAMVNYDKEWAQIFDEAWRAYRDGFYLKTMHGVDWKAIHDKYAVLLPYVKNRLDLTYVIGGMIGELACGHAYVDGGDAIGIDEVKIGMLGADIVADGGAYRITKIVRGAPDRSELRSPLDEPGVNVAEGNYITAVDGVAVSTVNNIYALLRGKAGVPTELTIADDASGRGARKVVVKPLQSEHSLRHHEWVQHNIDYVTERTGGRVGYVYIPDMGPEGLREFSRYYFAQTDREALIIDDRYNGGGNISPMVIERLLRQPYRMTMYRGSNYNGTIPEKTIYGPKVLLVNKYSASDGDLFPWSFKENKIGTVIGTRTWGGIVGISGSLPYIDGTDIRVPFFTNYDTRGNWIVENHGVDPDIVVDNDPTLEFQGIDQQLDKAIEVVLEQLKSRTPLPRTPAPRTMKDLGL